MQTRYIIVNIAKAKLVVTLINLQ